MRHFNKSTNAAIQVCHSLFSPDTLHHLFCSHKTPRHKQFVQKVFQEDDDEVEDFSNSSGSSSDAWPTLSAIQRPRKRRRTEKVSNRRKHGG